MTEEQIIQEINATCNTFLPEDGPMFHVDIIPSDDSTYIRYKVNHVLHDGMSCLRLFCTMQDGGKEVYLANNLERKVPDVA
jgi:hypothetical protein